MVAIVVDTPDFTRTLQRYVQGTRMDAEQAANRAAAIFMRNAIAITPPGDGKQTGQRAALTKQDQYRGNASIRADLAKLFVPIRLKRKRPEEWPDVAGLHRQAFITGKTPGKSIKRVGNKKYVDRAKLKTLERHLLSLVGRLAAYWLRAADLVKATGIPAWVRRHGIRGGGTLTRKGDPRWQFVAWNPAIPAPLIAEQARRMAYAERYTERALRANLEAVLAKNAARFNSAR